MDDIRRRNFENDRITKSFRRAHRLLCRCRQLAEGGRDPHIVQDLFRLEFCQQRAPLLTSAFNQRMAGHGVASFLCIESSVAYPFSVGESSIALLAWSTARTRRRTNTCLRGK